MTSEKIVTTVLVLLCAAAIGIPMAMVVSSAFGMTVID